MARATGGAALGAVGEKVGYGLQTGAERGRELTDVAHERDAEQAEAAREHGAERAEKAAKKAQKRIRTQFA